MEKRKSVSKGTAKRGRSIGKKEKKSVTKSKKGQPVSQD
jgi:hypothetical protein